MNQIYIYFVFFIHYIVAKCSTYECLCTESKQLHNFESNDCITGVYCTKLHDFSSCSDIRYYNSGVYCKALVLNDSSIIKGNVEETTSKENGDILTNTSNVFGGGNSSGNSSSGNSSGNSSSGGNSNSSLNGNSSSVSIDEYIQEEPHGNIFRSSVKHNVVNRLLWELSIFVGIIIMM